MSHLMQLFRSEQDASAPLDSAAAGLRHSRGPGAVCGSILLALSLLALAGCGKSHSGQAPDQREAAPVSVRVQKAENRQRVAVEEVVGTVRARQRATLEAKISGRIIEMPVLLGQSVRAGQLLARLDAAEIKARVDQAQAALEQAERDWKRVSSLAESQAATRSEYDAADSRLRVAKATVSEAQAMLAYAQVLAPFDGVIAKKWADMGDLAAPGKPLLDIQDPSALQVEADVPEAVGAQVSLGERMSVRLDGITNELSGSIVEISPAADPATRTFRVKLDLPTPSDDSAIPHSALRIPHSMVRPGQFIRLLAQVGKENPVCVPASALVRRGQMEIVFTLEKQHARMRLVRSGRTLGDEVEIVAGLEAGEPVVAEGAEQLIDGQPVEAK